MTVSGLLPNRGYYFAVKAYDDYQNASELSNSPLSHTGSVDFFAESQATDFGSHISGGLADIEASDNSYLVLEEQVLEDGPKPKRHDELIHTWTFTVPEGTTQPTLHVEAYHTFNLDYDDFAFSCSTDGVGFTDLLTVEKRSDDDQVQTAPLPEGICGTVYVRVVDTNRDQRAYNPNTLFVDCLFIRGIGPPDSNPPAFSGVESALDAGTGGAVDLFWSAASDPEGSEPVSYVVYQATEPGGQDFGNLTQVTLDTQYTATGLTDGVAYYFVVRARDTYGNEDSNTVEMSAAPSGGEPQCAMFVEEIALSVRPTGINWKAVAEVTLDADTGCSGEGAVVGGSWYLNEVFLGTGSAVADVNGVAVILTSPLYADTGDIFKFVVTAVTKDGVLYDPAQNVLTEASIVVHGVTPAADEMAGPAWLAPRTFGAGIFEFSLRLTDHAKVHADIYDASGRLVKRLARESMGPGPVRLVWDSSKEGEGRVPSGVYYYVVKAGADVHRGKLVVVR
jgi:hypothetical protein